MFSRTGRLCAGFLLLLAAGTAFVAASPVDDASGDAGDLKLVVVVSRHGVRPPLTTNQALQAYSVQPWPSWSVPPSFLTIHGRREMVLMGAYYRALYRSEGLLRGKSTEDRNSVYFVSDSDERTIETARALAEGILPGESVTVHGRPSGTPDCLFRLVAGRQAEPDLARAKAAMLGRLGGDPLAYNAAYRPALSRLQEILFDGSATPPGKIPLLSLPVVLRRGDHGETLDFAGPLHRAESMVDNLLLEYAEGMPLSEVGWGRVDRQTLIGLLRLHALYFDLTQRTFYPAQAQGSNLAFHLLATLEQAADDRAEPGAIGPVGERMVVIVGHDTNQANLGGLLGLEWWLPDTQANPMLPGGALVFELRQHGRGGPCSVRVSYVSASLDQMRSLASLDVANPPERASIFVPNCSGSGPGFDAPLPAFAERVKRAIDPAFVVPGNL